MMDDPTTAAGPSLRKRRLRRSAATLVVAVVLLLAVNAVRPHVYAGAVLQSPAVAPSLDGLVYDTGEKADLSVFRGDVVLLYFGYTHCPDLCPTTLAAAARARERLGAKSDRVHMVMVTVDPARDSADLLGEYVRGFDPTFKGVTGPKSALQRAEVVYGVNVTEHAAPEDLVDHTAGLMAIDPDGFLRVLYPTGIQPSLLASDLDALLR
jgi:protein SCO1/2